MTNNIIDERLRELYEADQWLGTTITGWEIKSIAAELLASRLQIESLKNELDLAHKMHDVAVKERNYERSLVNSLMDELNRKS